MSDTENYKSEVQGDLPRGAPHEGMSPGEYIATRIPTLKPPMAKVPNPFKALGLLNKQQWLFFACGFIAWTWDAFDFFTVSTMSSQLD